MPENVCQFNVGDTVMVLSSLGHWWGGVVNAVDIPTRRVRVIADSDGEQYWCYIEHCYKDS